MLIKNAKCWTGLASQPWADTMLVRDGRFVFVGPEAAAALPGDADTLDCRGRLVVPGFTDGHAHLLNTGMAMRSVNLKDASSVEDAVVRVAAAVSGTTAGAWVRGAGWDQHRWPDTRFPTRNQLDAIAPDTPVMLIHTSGHCIWVNSAALHAAGVTDNTQPPAGGEIGRDERGRPTGVLFDNAVQLIYAAMPSVTREDRAIALREAIGHAHALGVTGAHAVDVSRGELSALRTLHDDGALRFRTRVFLSGARLDGWLGQTRTGDGDDMLRIGGVKFFADGALGSLTAWMNEPYAGSSDVGFPLVEPDELERQVRACLGSGLAPAIHAIGDKANHEVLEILERTQDVAPELPRRIEHAQLLAQDDIARFGRLAITASVQPIHATQDMHKVDSHWGTRGLGAYAFAWLLASGANVAFGSDSPVETIDPLAGLHAAVTRRNARGEPEGGWYPDQRISVEAALRAYSTGCARAVNEEPSVGQLGPGFLADFVVLSRDILALDDPMDVLEARVDITVVGGEVVYRREGAW